MAKVFIIGQDFDDAGALADLLTRRRIDSIVIDGLGAPDTNPGKGNTLVCTAAAEQAAGGQSGLVTGARQLGITQLVIVAPGEDFSVEGTDPQDPVSVIIGRPQQVSQIIASIKPLISEFGRGDHFPQASPRRANNQLGTRQVPR